MIVAPSRRVAAAVLAARPTAIGARAAFCNRTPGMTFSVPVAAK